MWYNKLQMIKPPMEEKMDTISINAQRTTHNAQRTTHNAQRTTRTTHNAQRTTHNAQTRELQNLQLLMRGGWRQSLSQ